MNDNAMQLAARVAQRFSQLLDVQAVALAGSQATGAAGAVSDIDVYIYSQGDIPAEVRRGIGLEFAPSAEIVDFWGPGVEWDDPATGIHVDTIYFTVPWMEDQIDRLLARYQAQLGYTTCFWHTIRVSRVLFDRAGWFSRLQARAMQDYPDRLVQAIVARNFPVLRQIPPSYLHQLEKAASRGDLVSLNHRTGALFASYFDILFAINRLPHPGEKRLLDYAEQHCALLPVGFREQVNAVLQASVQPGASIKEPVNALVDGLETLIRRANIDVTRSENASSFL